MSALVIARPTGNRLLDRLPPEAFDALRPQLAAAEFRPGEVLPPGDVLFPASGLISLRLPLADGSEAEVELVGRDGLVGLAAAFGLPADPLRSVVRVAGAGYRAPTSAAPAAADGYLAFAWRAAHQQVACNLVHTIERRLPRLLLTVRDRLGADEFALTQADFADMLGATRQTVTGLAGVLQSAGLIAYRRGRVRILDPVGLAERSCECYAALRDLYDRVVG